MKRFVVAAALYGSTVLAGVLSGTTSAQAWCVSNGTNAHAYFRMKTRDDNGRGEVTRYMELPSGTQVCCDPGKHKSCERTQEGFEVAYDVKQGTLAMPAKIKWLKYVKWLSRVKVFYPSSGDTGYRPPIPICSDHGPYVKARKNADVHLYGSKGKTACDVYNHGWDPFFVSYARKGARKRSNLIVCNLTGTVDKLHVMYALYARDRTKGGNAGYWESRGYYAVQVPSCRRLDIGEPYYNGDIYLRIRGSDGKVLGGEDAFFCINKNKAFQQPRADKKCPPGFEKAGFFKRKLSANSKEFRVNRR
jgi:hypothetical protein